jgi:hypothetical protein
MIPGYPVITNACQELCLMNAVVGNSGNSEKKSASGKRKKPKQEAIAGDKPAKKAAKSKKPTAAESNATGRKRAGKKKTATRKKTTSRGKSAARGTGKPGKQVAAATDSARLASLPVDPPPVTFSDAAAAADDPKSLSWMAHQAVSALVAVKAHQAEKGKVIMARAEKDKPEQAAAVSGKQTGKPAQTTLADRPGDIADQQKPGNADQADTRAQPDVEQPPAESQQAGKPLLPGNVDGPAPEQPGVSATGGCVAAGCPPHVITKRRFPIRLQVLVAAVIAIPLWLYFGSDEEVGPVATHTEQGVTVQPMTKPASQSIPVPADTPVWQPATTVTRSQEPEPVSAGAVTGLSAAESVQPVAGTGAVSASEPAPQQVPAQPARPSGYRTPGYGYYPPQQSWQQPYYRPGYPGQPPR